jgi:hypothetical protein
MMEKENRDEDTFIEVDMFTVRYFTPNVNPRLTLICQSCGLRSSTGFRIDSTRANEDDGGNLVVERKSVVICTRCFAKYLEERVQQITDLAATLALYKGEL